MSPNELSFVRAGAWEDIYGHRLGNPSFPKDPLWHIPQVNGVRSILSANDADHSRIRRLLVHGFSEKALREQEPLIQSYVDLFMTRLLQKTAEARLGTATVNIAQWFNFITFDIIGDLSFGESFHCLEKSHYHPWIAILFSHFKALALSTCCRFFPFLGRLMLYTLPKAVKQQRIDHFNMSKEKVHQRIEAQQKQTWRSTDFMAHVLRHNDEKGMTLSEIESTFNILVVAGSETTATTLAGIMNYLLKDSTVLEPLVHEIRGSFASSSEITSDRVSRLPYLNAVIEEGLRLCQPVPLGSPRKVPPGGATVCGHWLPENVSAKPASFLIFRHPVSHSPASSFFTFSSTIFLSYRFFPWGVFLLLGYFFYLPLAPLSCHFHLPPLQPPPLCISSPSLSHSEPISHRVHQPQTSVSVPQYAVSLSALNYSSPTAFLPFRWLPTSHSWAATLTSTPSTPSSSPRPTANQAAFHPFSMGNRRCIGQSLAYLEMRLVLARLLWTFDIEQDGEAWAWGEQKTWILWEKKPLNVRLRKRA